MFPGNDGALSDSGGEEDFYFSDNDWLDLKCHVIENKKKKDLIIHKLKSVELRRDVTLCLIHQM